MLKRLKDLFVPHEGNNFRPDFLERLSVGIMLVLILLSFTMANLQALLWISSDWLVSTILPSVIVDLTNDERDTESLSHLSRSAVLDEAARLKANDMAQNGYFAHYSPAGVSPWHWFDEAGYDYLHAGENLAVHFTDSDEVVEAWMNSPTHRANILNGDYAEIGVGTAKGEYKGHPTIFVVQLFGTPRMSEVAGATAVNPPDEITIEKVAMAATPADVAPATVDREPLGTPAEQEEEAGVNETEPVLKEDAREKQEIPALAPVSAVPKESVIMMTDLATTSREGVPAQVTNAVQNGDDGIPLPLHTATASSLWLSMLYSILALFVVGALTASLTLEWRRHHPIQTAYAGGLLAVMALLLYIHTALTSHVAIL